MNKQATALNSDEGRDHAWAVHRERWRMALHKHLEQQPIEPILHPVSSRLKSFALMMLLGNPFYYVVWAHVLIQPYENLAARLLVSLLASVLLLPQVNRDPNSLRTGVLFVGIVWVQLPVFFIWMYLCNGGAPVWMASVVGMILIWYHVTDWRIASVGLVLATLTAWSLFSVTKLPSMAPWPAQDIFTHAVIISFGLFMAVLLGVFSANAKQVRMKLTQAQALQRALQSLAGSIAHEMRNPLGQVQHALSMSADLLPELRHNAMVWLTPQQLDGLQRHLAQGHVAIKRGLQVIDMTLDEVNFRPLDPAQFVCLGALKTVQKAVDEYGLDAVTERARVHVHTLRDFDLKGCETALIFVLFNLLRNALYYFKQHPAASITITIEEPCIRIRDTGPGIPEPVRLRLFEAFQTAGKSGGTGLGLAYCQRVMHAFGGHIACDSMPGQYTEFTLRFVPLSPADRTAMALDEAPPPMPAQPTTAEDLWASIVLQGKTLMVADDVDLNRGILRAYAERWSMQVIEATHGQEVLTMLNEQGVKVDALVLDLHMPGLGGLELTRILRASVHHKHLPIMALSGSSDAHTRQMAKEAGMDAFVSKPFEAKALQKTLSQLLAAAPQDTPKPAPGSTMPADDDNGTEALLSLEHLQELQRHAPRFLLESWPAYRTQLEVLQARIRTAMEQCKHEELYQSVHTLVGSSGNVGALAVHRFLRLQVLPDLARGRWPRDPRWLETLNDLCQRTEHQMSQYLEQQAMCKSCV